MDQMDRSAPARKNGKIEKEARRHEASSPDFAVAAERSIVWTLYTYLTHCAHINVQGTHVVLHDGGGEPRHLSGVQAKGSQCQGGCSGRLGLG